MSSEPTNKALYNKVKSEAKRKFKNWPSLYGSSWLQAEYKRRGGKYKGKKPSKKTGTSRWYSEQWVQVESYLKTGKKVQCGSSIKKTKACRPLKRISTSTPPTIPELLKMGHTKTSLIKLAKQKQKDMKGTVRWKSGTFTPSKSKGSSPAYSPKSSNTKRTKLGKYTAEWSKGSNNKKYKVILYNSDGTKFKTVQFGDKRYEQYKDSTPLKLYSSKNHMDKNRRKNYRTRHGAQGYQNKKYSAAWFSYYYLW